MDLWGYLFGDDEPPPSYIWDGITDIEDSISRSHGRALANSEGDVEPLPSYIWDRIPDIEDSISRSRGSVPSLHSAQGHDTIKSRMKSGSVSFYKAVLEQADEKDSRNLLQKAVNSCYESAIRIAIGLLKEADRKIDKVGEILNWGIRFMHLQREGVENDKKVSKEEAEFVEQSSFVIICKDAIHKTIANWEKNLMKRVLRMNDQSVKQESGKDLKRKLHEIFDEDWNNIPEGEDFSSLYRNRAEELASALDAIPISGVRAIDPEVYLAGLQFEDELRSFDLDSRRNM